MPTSRTNPRALENAAVSRTRVDDRIAIAFPQRRHFLMAAVFFTGIAIYGSLVPLNFRAVGWEQAVERFGEIRYLQLDIKHRADWVANILLFIPIGLFWLAAFRCDRVVKSSDVIYAFLVVASGFALSAAIEFSQIWFPPRTVSQNDIAAETIGSFVGVILWMWAGPPLVEFARSRVAISSQTTFWQRALWIYTFVFLVYCILPLDLTINPKEIYLKYQEGKFGFIPFGDLRPTVESLSRHFADLLFFVPIGCLAWIYGTPNGGTSRTISTSMIALGVVLGTEVAQIFIYSRFAEVTDVLLGWMGVVFGVVICGRLNHRGHGAIFDIDEVSSLKSWVGSTIALLSCTLLLLIIFWWPWNFDFEPPRGGESLDAYFRLPLASLYWDSEFHAITQILVKSLAFLPLGWLASQAFLMRHTNERVIQVFQLVALLYCLAVAVAVEIGQIALPTRTSDSTDTAIYLLGGLAGWVAANRYRRITR